jgi:Flp pilus assembly protein TadD
VISLLPTLNPFNLSSIVAERYVYFGFTGLYFVCGYVLTKYIKNTKYLIIILFIIVSLLSIRTISRNADWKNNYSFWQATVQVSPSDPKAHNSLGGEYLKQNNVDLAINEFNTAIQLSPNFYAPYYNLAVTYKFNNKPDLALKYYLLAFEKNQKNWETCHNISILYFQKKDIVNAEKYINQCIEIAPDQGILFTNLGLINKAKGNKEGAKKAFLKALSLEPGSEIIMKELRELE